MDATRRTSEEASRHGVEERDVRALTEYLTVLEDVGRARDADDHYLVVSQSGREYLVDAGEGICECDDFRFRGGECKHLRRVAFATGTRAIPTAAAIEFDVDPSLGEHVRGDLRYVATDGDETTATGDHATTTGTWLVRDRDRGRVREFDSRSAATAALEDLEGLGLDVELLAPDSDDEFERRSIADDPVAWLPDEFVDWIDGTPAINRKGFEVLAHFYGVSVESDVEVSPADADFEYAQVKATATMPDGRRCEALGSAHVDRGDDLGVLLELADTRARKRAISVATGMGTVAVEELRSEVGEA